MLPFNFLFIWGGLCLCVSENYLNQLSSSASVLGMCLPLARKESQVNLPDHYKVKVDYKKKSTAKHVSIKKSRSSP